MPHTGTLTIPFLLLTTTACRPARQGVRKVKSTARFMTSLSVGGILIAHVCGFWERLLGDGPARLRGTKSKPKYRSHEGHWQTKARNGIRDVITCSTETPAFCSEPGPPA